MGLLADSNIWVALTFAGHEFHPAVSDWLARLAGNEPVCFCRSTQQSFLRLLTTETLLARFNLQVITNADAWPVYERLAADARFGWLDEPADLEPHWKKWSSGPTASPKRWMDAYLAAFALAGGHRFVTTDKAFKRFDRLDLVLLPTG